MYTKKNVVTSALWVLLSLLVFTSHPSPVGAQIWGLPGLLGQNPLSPTSGLGGVINRDAPGLADPSSPVVYLPFFRGELRARPQCVFLTKNQFTAPGLGLSVDLTKDLNFSETVVMIEFMGRVQMGRFSLRINQDAWLHTSRSDLGHISWPSTRLGADVDLVDTNTARLGANVDVSTDKTRFSAVVPNRGTFASDFERPITAGVHAALNPLGVGGLSFSFDTRARWPLTQHMRITDFEIAGGLKTPLTMLGTSAVRAGWRYTSLELRSENPTYEIDTVWSGVFGELVYFY